MNILPLELIGKLAQFNGNPLKDSCASFVGCQRFHILVEGDVSAGNINAHIARAATGNRTAFYMDLSARIMTCKRISLPVRQKCVFCVQFFDNTVALNSQRTGKAHVISAVVSRAAFHLEFD